MGYCFYSKGCRITKGMHALFLIRTYNKDVAPDLSNLHGRFHVVEDFNIVSIFVDIVITEYHLRDGGQVCFQYRTILDGWCRILTNIRNITESTTEQKLYRLRRPFTILVNLVREWLYRPGNPMFVKCRDSFQALSTLKH